MTTYIIRRLLGMIPTLLVLLLMVVVMVRMIPGDIVDILLEERGGLGSERAALDRAELEKRLGLDRPLFLQYVGYVGGMLRGNFGHSLWDQRPVEQMIWERVPVTAEVALIAIVVSVAIALPVGVISAVRQDSVADYVLRSLTVLGLSIPNFAIGIAIVIFPALWFGWSVPFRYVSLTEDPVRHLSMVGPAAIVLGVALSASVARMTRTMMLEVMQEDYIRTARAKGLTGRAVVIRHALKNALIPVVTLMGLQITFLIGGSVITETIFALPGLGRLLIQSIGSRDYPVIQGIVVMVGFFVMLINLLVDLSYAYLDPRVRYA